MDRHEQILIRKLSTSGCTDKAVGAKSQTCRQVMHWTRMLDPLDIAISGSMVF